MGSKDLIDNREMSIYEEDIPCCCDLDDGPDCLF